MKKGILVEKLRQLNIIDEETAEELIAKIENKGHFIMVFKKLSTGCIAKVDKGEFFVVMEYLKETYNENNEVSRQLIEIIPELEEISIDEPRCESMEVPCIVCRKKDNQLHAIAVRRTHRIIWAILNECKNY